MGDHFLIEVIRKQKFVTGIGALRFQPQVQVNRIRFADFIPRCNSTLMHLRWFPDDLHRPIRRRDYSLCVAGCSHAMIDRHEFEQIEDRVALVVHLSTSALVDQIGNSVVGSLRADTPGHCFRFKVVSLLRFVVDQFHEVSRLLR